MLPRRAKVNLMTRHKRFTALFLSAFFAAWTKAMVLPDGNVTGPES